MYANRHTQQPKETVLANPWRERLPLLGPTQTQGPCRSPRLNKDPVSQITTRAESSVNSGKKAAENISLNTSESITEHIKQLKITTILLEDQKDCVSQGFHPGQL
jgi:hypothetical protein